MSDLNVVGHSHPQIDGMEKAMGQTQFVSDLVLPNMLHGRILRSPYPHAHIKHIDTSRAETLVGVKAVATYADTPGIRFGPRTEDWTIFARDRARFCGDEIAAVAALDEDTAEEALDLIEVEYEDLPFVTDPIEAMKPGAPLIHEDLPLNSRSRQGMWMRHSRTRTLSMKIVITPTRCTRPIWSRWAHW